MIQNFLWRIIYQKNYVSVCDILQYIKFFKPRSKKVKDKLIKR